MSVALSNLFQSIKHFWALPISFLGTVTTIVMFVQLWRGDRETVTWTAAVVGFASLLFVLLYVAVCTSISNLDPTRRVPKYPRLCKPARWGAGVYIILGLVAGALLYMRDQAQWGKIVVAVANFQAYDKTDKYQVTDIVIHQLHQSLSPYNDTLIQPLDASIKEQQGSEEARAVGDRLGAHLVVWGWYAVTESNVWLTVHVEDLTLSEKLHLSTPKPYNVPVATLNSFQFQERFSESMSALALFVSGIVRYEKQDYPGAIQRMSEALQYNWPEDLTAKACVYFYLGTSRLLIGELPQAVEDLSQAIILKPEFAEAYFNRAFAYNALNETDKAIADYSKSIAIKPQDYESYNNRGLAYATSGRYQEAIEDYNRAIQIDPNYAPAYYNLGLTYGATGRNDEAIAQYSHAIQINSQYADAYNDRGIAYAELNKPDDAITDFSQAVQINPQFAAAYFNRGYLYETLSDYPNAIADFRKVIGLSDNQALRKKAEMKLSRLSLSINTGGHQ